MNVKKRVTALAMALVLVLTQGIGTGTIALASETETEMTVSVDGQEQEGTTSESSETDEEVSDDGTAESASDETAEVTSDTTDETTAFVTEETEAVETAAAAEAETTSSDETASDVDEAEETDEENNESGESADSANSTDEETLAENVTTENESDSSIDSDIILEIVDLDAAEESTELTDETELMDEDGILLVDEEADTEEDTDGEEDSESYNIWFSQVGDLDDSRQDEYGNTWSYVGEELTLTVDTSELDADEDLTYDLVYEIGNWPDEEDSDWTPYELTEGYSIDGSTITLGVSTIAESIELEAGNGGFHVRVYATDSDDNEIAEAYIWISYWDPYYDYQLPYGDWSALPDWDYWISSTFNCYVEDPDHPWGDNVDITISSVTVANAEDEESEEDICEENSDDYSEGYNIHTLSEGHAVATVTYSDLDGNEVTDTFDIYVGGDVYSLDISSSTGKDHLLPGADLDLTASVWHDVYYYDEDSEEYVYDGYEAEDISFEWDLADENDREYLTIEKDTDDSAVLHVTAADELEDDYDVQICVTVYDSTKSVIASGDYWIYIRSGYYQLVLTEDVNTDLEVGETTTVVPELRLYSSDTNSEDGYDVVEDVQYRWDWDESAVRITDADGTELYYDEDSNEHTYGSANFTLTKLENWGTGLTLYVETANEDGEYDETETYDIYLNELGYGIWYEDAANQGRFDEWGNTWGYTDESLTLTYETDISEDYDSYTIQVDAGEWVETDETDENGDSIYEWSSYELDSDSGVSCDGSTITLDITAIAEAATGASVEDEDFSYDGFNVRVVIIPTAEEFSDYELNVADIWVGYCEPYYDYQVPYGDWSALPDWDYWISSTFNCYVDDADHPWGEDIEITITDVTVENAEDEESEETICEENSDNHEDGYNLHTLALGHAVVTVTYNDINEDEVTDTFNIYVGGDVYSLDISSDTGTDNILPGESLDLTASVWHDVYYYDEDSEEYVYDGYEEEGISCEWSLADEDNSAYLTIEKDTDNSAILHVTAADDLEDDYDVQVYVSVCDSNGDETASGDYWIYIRNNYYQLVLTEDVNTDLEVGETTTVVPELRLYSSDTDSEDGYDVVEDVQYRWDWDESAVRITDADDTELYYDEDSNEHTYGSADFTLTKLENWGTDLTLHAETANEDGDYEEVTDYWFYLNELGYGIWYEDVADQGRFDEWGNTWGYTGESLTLTYETDISEDYGSYEIQVDAGEWVETDETDENGDSIYEWSSYGLDSDSGVSCEDGMITLDITAIAEAATDAYVEDEDFSYEGFSVRVVAVPTAAEFSNYELYAAEIWVGYYEPYYDYQLPYGNWSALPEWDYWISSTFNCYVNDADHPWGEDVEITITNVTVANADDEESEETICEENSENHEDGYNLYTLSIGHAVATVTYTDVNGNVVEDTFDIYVGGDVYSLDISSSTEKDHLLPGASLDLTASVWHDVYYYDDESEEYVYDGYEAEDISFEWSLADENDSEYLTIEQDEDDAAVLHVTAADDLEEDYDVQIYVSVYDSNGDEIASGDHWIYIRNSYHQLVLTEEINTDLEVGETTNVVPELRLYSSDTDSEGGYDVIEDVQYRWDWDENAVRITDADGNDLYYEEDSNENTYGSADFTLTKLENWGTDLTLYVETPNDDGDYEEVADYGIYLNGLDYGIGFSWAGNDEENCRFNEDGNTWGYTDETLALNYESYISDELDAYEILVDVGTWEETDETDEEGNIIYNFNSYGLDSDTGVSIDTESGTISLDMTAIAEAATGASVEEEGFEYDGFNVRVVVVPTAEEFSEYELNVADIWVSYHTPYYELEDSYTTDILLGRGFIYEDNTINYYVENENHPWGEDIALTIENISSENVTDEEDDIFEITSPDDNEDGTWQIWSKTVGTATVTYLTTSEEFGDLTIDVERTVYSDMDYMEFTSSTDTDQILPDASLDLTAALWHESASYDDEGNYSYESYCRDDGEDISYEWSLADEENDGDYISIGADSDDSSVLHVTAAADQEDRDVQICVTAYDSDGEEIYSDEYWIYIRNSYYVIAMDSEISVPNEESLTLTPEMILYTTDEPDGTVVDDEDVTWEITGWDDSLFTLDEDGMTVITADDLELGDDGVIETWLDFTGTIKESEEILYDWMTVYIVEKTELTEDNTAIALDAASYTYTGSEIEPTVTVTFTTDDGEEVTLTADEDYTISYSDNIDAGTKATVTVTGSYFYSGSVSETFAISQASQTLTATAAASSITYGETTTITASTTGDGALAYSSSDTSVASVSSSGVVTGAGVGTATITVTAAETTNYSRASETITITVTAASIASASVLLDKTSYTYDGTAKEPGVTVTLNGTTLTKDTDYTLTYSNNTSAGTASVTATGTGNYTDTTSAKTFTIAQASQTVTATAAASSIEAGSTTTISASTTGDGKLTYSSSNTSVAIVDSSSGVVT
ncbi:MAG: hypothetical protein LUG99_07640, partial [Lachnospiraceae bacterium]|nr:hypothetical protein [Lachnospiraceae bacterium]